MLFFDFLFGRSARRRKQSLRRRSLKLERLESRTTPTASGVVSGSTLTITGGGGGYDQLNLNLDPTGSELVLLESNQVVGQFSNAAVQDIVINATALNNNISVSQSVLQATTIQGGAGSNILQAGSGPTLLIAGPGANRIMGGSGNDTINGMQGVNVIATGGGQNIIMSGVLGQNTVFGITGDDTILNTSPLDHLYVGTPPPAYTQTLGLPPSPDATLSSANVTALLNRAAAATASDDAIVAVVDRGGRILGVRVEGNVSSDITSNVDTEVFAIDGAVAETRTGALFANNTAPLTSRTIQFISQTTITQREVESNPSIQDPNSTLAGPGFVAPIGVQGNFPPGIMNTPQVDLFDIEATNRDTTLHPGVDGMADAVPLAERFNVNSADIPTTIPTNEDLQPMNSYGYVSGLEEDAEPRGIGTLPGGIPIYANVNGQQVLVGGIGVFSPGTTGYADAENSSLSSNYNPNLPDLSLQAEYIAFAAVGGDPALGLGVGALGGVSLPSDLFNGVPLPPNAQINLNGITLPILGPDDGNGPQELFNYGQDLGQGNPNSGFNAPLLQPDPTTGNVDPTGNNFASGGVIAGTLVPEGWLVTPHAGTTMSAAQVEQIIEQGVAQAEQTRAQIRLPLDTPASMVFAVSDPNTGEVLGLFRMPDATVFSIDVAVAKSRNVAYYDNTTQLQPQDQTDGVAPGTSLTNRTFRFLAEPLYPEGQNGSPPGQFSILNDGGSSLTTGLNTGAPLPASDFTSVMGHDAFNPETNFHDPYNILNQNGIVFFPGSSALYTSDGTLIGGFGASGDGVSEDDFITYGAVQGFGPPSSVTRADQVSSRGVNLPYIEFDRQPFNS